MSPWRKMLDELSEYQNDSRVDPLLTPCWPLSVPLLETAFRILLTKDMALLSLTFLYTGRLRLSAINPANIRYVKSRPSPLKVLSWRSSAECTAPASLTPDSSGMQLIVTLVIQACWSVSERSLVGITLQFAATTPWLNVTRTHLFAGGLIFGILGKIARKYGRNLIVLLGFLLHILSFFLIFLNLPDDTPTNVSSAPAYIEPR